jgi:hypothetical protein
MGGGGCGSLWSSARLLVLEWNTSLNRTLILLLRRAAVISSSLALALPETSPLWFRRCSRKRLRAEMRSSEEASGRERKYIMSRKAERRRCVMSVSGCRGGASESGSCSSSPAELREVVGRKSTRLVTLG